MPKDETHLAKTIKRTDEFKSWKAKYKNNNQKKVWKRGKEKENEYDLGEKPQQKYK